MNQVRVELDGMAEFRAALQQLPDALAEEGKTIVLAHAQEAAQLVESAYPTGPTGNLKNGVRVKITSASRDGVDVTLYSAAPHAHLYEWGTKRRAFNGANRGVMPKGRRMIPIAVRVRQRMTEALMGIVRKAGFEVKG